MLLVNDISVVRAPEFKDTKDFETKKGFKYFLASTKMLSRHRDKLLDKLFTWKIGLFSTSEMTYRS